ncbi:MAG TPA: heme-binding protein [Aromatoleum sp.]|uniref:GlcG/HbpS family heme-binding protein n=1 Tax=Aromatoleum sp. TaxID=2307007 RepID=UPI002B486537|nr:heme-binding protein [Aromatoleum sp.]HJV25963.1 heme-binding protein [Aromatoleum sp.]
MSGSSVTATTCLTITRHAAQQAAVAAIEEAERLGVSVNVAVVDRSGVLIAFLRMPDASLHSIDVAMDKAYTAASFRFPTSQWGEVLAGFSEPVQRGIVLRPRLVVFGGGVPIEADGQVIGAIGVSGASEDEDERCARAGWRAVVDA